MIEVPVERERFAPRPPAVSGAVDEQRARSEHRQKSAAVGCEGGPHVGAVRETEIPVTPGCARVEGDEGGAISVGYIRFRENDRGGEQVLPVGRIHCEVRLDERCGVVSGRHGPILTDLDCSGGGRGGSEDRGRHAEQK